MKILMVCMGNICRSPIMQGCLQSALAADPALSGRIGVDSAAIGAWHVGHPPDPRAIKVAATHGIDIAGQRARQLHRDDFDHFDLILFADADILRDGCTRVAGQGSAVLARYVEWAGIDGEPDLADPYYGDARDFDAVFQRIQSANRAIVQRLVREQG